MRIRLSSLRWRAIGAVGVCLFAVGCGSGEYQKRLNATINRLKEQSAFAGMSEPISLPGTKLTFCVPKDFVNAADKADDPLHKKLLSPGPLRPEQADAGAFYMHLTESKPELGEDLPALTLHWGRRDPATGGKQDPSSELMYALQDALPNKELKWEEVSLPTPEGGALTWQKLEASGNMEFVMVKCADGALTGAKRMKGDLHLYIHKHQESEVFVWMVWRVPELIAGDVGLESLVRQVGGTLKAKAD